MQPGELNKLTRREQVRLFRQHRRENAAVQKLFVEMTDRLVVDPEEYESMYEPIVVGTATLDNEMQLRVVELCEPNGHGGHHAEVRQMSSEPAQVDIAITHGRNSDVDVPASLPVVVLP